MNPKQLVDQFADAVQAQNECIRRHDAEQGNEFAHAYTEAGRTLLAGGDTAIDAFAALLDHTDPGVRAMAGAFLLATRTEQAVAALMPIAAGGGIAALGARTTLERHKTGDLQLTFE